MFLDKARIFVKGGDGGDGQMSFRREKYIPEGGPSGGDGGRGGNVIFRVDTGMTTLQDFRYKRHYKADSGEKGQTKNMHGRGADDTFVRVPPGTVIRNADTGEMIADLISPDQEVVIAKGGRGGRGNARFVSSVNRIPRFAEKGEPGQELWVELELKLLADVGLIGYPSVGKSSILARVSAAKPEIAAYHFTTLSPVLGVVSVGEEQNFVLADIPGLIEGAHEGVGLGHEFLRHVDRTKLLIHVLDMAGSEGRDPIADFEMINTELRLYSERLGRRPQIIAANKMDLPEGAENLQRFREYIGDKYEIFPVSAATGEGLKDLMRYVAGKLPELQVELEEEEPIEEKVYSARANQPFEISRDEEGAWVITGKDIERLVAMTNFDNDDAVQRFQKIWRRLEIEAALKEAGAENGDPVRIREVEFEYYDQTKEAEREEAEDDEEEGGSRRKRRRRRFS
jgi:GTP-binding protein